MERGRLLEYGSGVKDRGDRRVEETVVGGDGGWPDLGDGARRRHGSRRRERSVYEVSEGFCGVWSAGDDHLIPYLSCSLTRDFDYPELPRWTIRSDEISPYFLL